MRVITVFEVWSFRLLLSWLRDVAGRTPFLPLFLALSRRLLVLAAHWWRHHTLIACLFGATCIPAYLGGEYFLHSRAMRFRTILRESAIIVPQTRHRHRPDVQLECLLDQRRLVCISACNLQLSWRQGTPVRDLSWLQVTSAPNQILWIWLQDLCSSQHAIVPRCEFWWNRWLPK